MKRNVKDILSKIGNALLIIATVIMCCIIAFNLTHEKIVVVGISMQPTVEDQEVGYMQKVFKHTKIERFDIVAVEITNETNYIKRIVGLPGETVQISGDDIYVNGTLIEQPFAIIPVGDNEFDGTYTMADNEYFILGDNRRDTVPPIKITRDKILGKNGFIVADCKSFDGETCLVKDKKKWRKLNG